jgi:hypothetical protein
MSLASAPEVIAERNLICVRRDGERIAVTLRIAKPRPAQNGDWTCRVEAAGLLDGAKDIYGIDSFQALFLGQALLKSLVRHEIERGSSFLAFEPEEPVGFEAIFGKDI